MIACTNSTHHFHPRFQQSPLGMMGKTTFTLYYSARRSSMPLLLPFLVMQVERAPALSAFGAFTKKARGQSMLKPQLKCFFIFVQHFCIQIPWISARIGPLSFLQPNHVYMEAGTVSVGPTSHSLHNAIQKVNTKDGIGHVQTRQSFSQPFFFFFLP